MLVEFDVSLLNHTQMNLVLGKNFKSINFVMAIDILKTTMVEKLPSDLEASME